MFTGTGNIGTSSLFVLGFSHYFDKLHDLFVIVPRFYKNVCTNCFFFRAAGAWDSVLAESFPFTYVLSCLGPTSVYSKLAYFIFGYFLVSFLFLCLVATCLILADNLSG